MGGASGRPSYIAQMSVSGGILATVPVPASSAAMIPLSVSPDGSNTSGERGAGSDSI